MVRFHTVKNALLSSLGSKQDGIRAIQANDTVVGGFILFSFEVLMIV